MGYVEKRRTYRQRGSRNMNRGFLDCWSEAHNSANEHPMDPVVVDMCIAAQAGAEESIAKMLVLGQVLKEADIPYTQEARHIAYTQEARNFRIPVAATSDGKELDLMVN